MSETKSGRRTAATARAPLALKVAFSLTSLLFALALFSWISYKHPGRSGAALRSITTTAVDNAQIYVPYTFQLTGSNADTDPTMIWTVTSGAGTLAGYGLSMDSTGLITGTPNAITISGAPISFTVRVRNTLGTDFAEKAFTLAIAGRSSFYFATVNPADSSVPPGATNVPIAQFAIQTMGEDVRFDSIMFWGLGTGSDTFDVTAVRIWLDSNANGRVDAGEVQLKSSTFSTNQGYNPSVSFGGIGYIIDSHLQNGWETFIVTYDFRATVEPARTFRLAMEQFNVGWYGMSSGFTSGQSLSGGDPMSQQRSVGTAQLGTGIPYKSGVITIVGNPPLVPTLFVSDSALVTGIVNVAAGAVDQVALPLNLWTDSAHTIIVDQLVLSDSGSGLPLSHLVSAKLYYDLDANGAYSANDVFLKTGTITNVDVTFPSLSLMVKTPTGLPTDPSAVHLIVAYTFKSDVPALASPLTFQAILASASSITAREQVTGNAATVVTGEIPGNVFRVVSGSLSSIFIDTGTGAFPTISTINKTDSVVVWRGRVWSDSGHRIRLTGLKFTALGNLEDRYDVNSVRLIKDRDASGSVTSGDIIIFSTSSYANDNDSMWMTGFNEIIHTPTGANSDSNVLNLLVVYSLNGNAPESAGLQFTTSLLATSDVQCRVYESAESVSFVSGPPLQGRWVVVSGKETTTPTSTGNGPYIISSTLYDADTSGTVTQNDYIIVAFDTNLAVTSTALASDFIPMPVTGDGLGVGAAVTFFGGNKLKITLGSSPFLTVSGVYALGVHAAFSASGLNLKDTIATITSGYGKAANPSSQAVDIGGDTSVATNAGPFPTAATFSDVDGSYSVTRNDQIVVTFSDNITITAPPTNTFWFPVIGDGSGASGQTISQTAGNKLTITFADTPTFRVSGTYAAGTHGVGSPSGINLTAVTNTIRDSAGRSAVPAAAAVDIGGMDTGTLDSAPYPTSAVYYDADTDNVVSASDYVDLYFSKNITVTGLPANKIFLPVTGDYLANAAIAQIGGNRVRITVGNSAVLKISGTFAVGTTTAGSASGINLSGVTSAVQDLDGRSATPAPAALDITSGSSWFSDAGGGTTTGGTAATLNGRGDKACVISRNLPETAFLGILRALRDAVLGSSLGRWVVEAYYAL